MRLLYASQSSFGGIKRSVFNGHSMGSQRSIFLKKNTVESLTGTLCVANNQIFVTDTGQSLMGTLWVAKGQYF